MKMPQTYPRCWRNATHNFQSYPRGPIDPKSCPCDGGPASSDETKKIEEKNNNVTSLLTPKSSFDTIEKPKVEEIEIAIFLERILSLLGRIMKKLELAAALPIILADPEICDIIGASEMKIVEKACNDVDNHRRAAVTRAEDQSLSVDSSSLSRQSFDDSDTMSYESACNGDNELSNSRLYGALQILNGHSSIRKKIESRRNEISLQSKLFLRHMKYFIEHCVRRISSTPVQVKIREEHFRNIWHENHRAQQDIDALLNYLEEQRTSHHDLMSTIGSQYKKDCDIVERLNRKCVEDMKSTVDRSERKQIMEHKHSEMRQDDLSQYLRISMNKLEILRETNLRLEQEIRSKRFKVSSQLIGQIGKFDAEVGERYRILGQLNEEFELEKMKKEKLEEEMMKQLEIHNVFKEEIEAKELAIFQEKFDAFVRNRAAKKIQRWWRPIFGRLKLRKKKKAKKKKKK